MIRWKLEQFVKNRCCTLLGVGVVSKNCVDATIELADEYRIPLILILSRRQVDSAEFNGGYVNNWTTASFAEYVADRDKKGNVILARDHGGPWQNDVEKKERMSVRHAMASAKKSFKADIEAGIDVIHIDTSMDIHGAPSVGDVLQRLFELYEYCWSETQHYRRDIIFEIGTEEQRESPNSKDELEYLLNEVFKFCQEGNLPKPTFVVVQTGTKVMETRNVGTFDYPLRIVDELPAIIQVPRTIETCKKFNVFVKEHNADYLSDESLAWHPKLGIHSANVAPEFGVAETIAFIDLLRKNKMDKFAEDFLEIAYESNKWRKWMVPETTCTETEKAIIAGHYIFSDERFIEIKRQAQASLSGTEIDDWLKYCIKQNILRYLKNFHLV